MSKVYVVKYERELDNVDDVVYVTTDKSKAEEVVETFVKELCWIEEYPLDTIIPDIDEVN